MLEVVALVVICRSANKKGWMEQEEKEGEQEENKGRRSAWGSAHSSKSHYFAFLKQKSVTRKDSLFPLNWANSVKSPQVYVYINVFLLFLEQSTLFNTSFPHSPLLHPKTPPPPPRPISKSSKQQNPFTYRNIHQHPQQQNLRAAGH